MCCWPESRDAGSTFEHKEASLVPLQRQSKFLRLSRGFILRKLPEEPQISTQSKLRESNSPAAPHWAVRFTHNHTPDGEYMKAILCFVLNQKRFGIVYCVRNVSHTHLFLSSWNFANECYLCREWSFFFFFLVCCYLQGCGLWKSRVQGSRAVWFAECSPQEPVLYE